MQSINATRKISGAHNWAGLYANVFGGSAQHFLDSNRSVDAWKQQKKKADLDIPVWFVFLRSLCDGHRIELHHLVFNGIFSFKGVWNWPYHPPPPHSLHHQHGWCRFRQRLNLDVISPSPGVGLYPSPWRNSAFNFSFPFVLFSFYFIEYRH